MSTVQWKMGGAVLMAAAMMTGADAQAEIVALRSDGTATYIHNPNTGEIVSTINPASSSASWAGVTAFDVDPTLPGDEVILTRQLDPTIGGANGFFVFSNQSGGDRLGYAQTSGNFLAVTTAFILDGGTRAGVVSLRLQPSDNRALFGVWDPATLLGGGDRVEYHLGRSSNQTWDPNIIVTGNVSAATPGDEVMVLRESGGRTLIEMYGRTEGQGNRTYNRVNFDYVPRSIQTFTLAQGILPGGEDAFVFLREDGRITFWGLNFMQYTEENPAHSTGYRHAFTPADSGFENFIRVADVLDDHDGQELIVGYHDVTSGERGYRLYAMPDQWDNREHPLTLLGSFDLGGEIRNIDVMTIPEPASAAMVLMAAGVVATTRRRRTRTQ